MKKLLRLTLFLLVCRGGYIWSQGSGFPGPNIEASLHVGCDGCRVLRSGIVGGFAPTTYEVVQIPYSPFPDAGTPSLVGIDDEWSPLQQLGFPFCFFGNTYTKCVFSSNGQVTFDASQANGYASWPISSGIPGNADVYNTIMGCWHDIDPSVGGTIRYTVVGAAPARAWVLTYSNVPMFSCTNLLATQQIVLYETTNVIEVYLQDKPSCPSWNGGYAIEGLQNASGTVAALIPGRNYPDVWTANHDAWAFVPGGVPTHTTTWYELGDSTPLATSEDITVCPTVNTDYVVQVVYTNCNGAQATFYDTVSVSAIPVPLGLDSAQAPVSCYGASDGSASMIVNGNQAPITYLWSNGDTSSSISGMPAGTYQVTVTESEICSYVATVTIGTPAPLSTTVTSTPEILGFDGAATAIPAGGNGGYSYLWSNGQTTQTNVGLSAGHYVVTVTDSLGCSDTAAVDIPLVIGLGPTVQEELIRIGPNPVEDLLWITPTVKLRGKIRLNLFAADGRLVYVDEVQASHADPIRISFASFPTGEYTLLIETSQGRFGKKILHR